MGDPAKILAALAEGEVPSSVQLEHLLTESTTLLRASRGCVAEVQAPALVLGGKLHEFC